VLGWEAILPEDVGTDGGNTVGFSSRSNPYPDDDLIVVLLTTSDHAVGWGLEDQIGELGSCGAATGTLSPFATPPFGTYQGMSQFPIGTCTRGGAVQVGRCGGRQARVITGRCDGGGRGPSPIDATALPANTDRLAAGEAYVLVDCIGHF
jgi:hypothetical protein